MAFGTTQKDNAATPVGSVYVPNTSASDLTALEGIAINTDGNSQKSSAVRMGLKDGDDVTQGAQADVAVVGDNPGTLSAKLRGLAKIWNDVWDSANHRIKVDGSAVTQPVSGTVSAIGYGFNGGAVGNQNYDRIRTLQGLGLQTTTIVSGGGVGSTAPVLTAATGLQPGQWVLLTGGTSEWVLTTTGYTAGSTTLALTTAIVNASHTGAQWNAYTVNGPVSNLFLLESVFGQALILNSPTAGQGILAQADASGNLKTVAQNASWTQIYSTTQTAQTAWAGSGDLTLSNYSKLAVTFNVTSFTGGTSPTIALRFSRKDTFGNYSAPVTGTALSATGTQGFSIGEGMTSNVALANIGSFSIVLVSTPTFTFTLDVLAR